MNGGRRLFFLRHGRADRSQFTGHDDDLRPLVAEGRRRLHAVGRTLAHADPGIDTVITSPLVRAHQTATIVSEYLGLAGDVLVDQRLGLWFDEAALVAVLADLAADRRRIMLVGHEPGFSHVIGSLTGGAVVMKKGALARVDLWGEDPLRGQLAWLLPTGVLVNDRDPEDDAEPGAN